MPKGMFVVPACSLPLRTCTKSLARIRRLVALHILASSVAAIGRQTYDVVGVARFIEQRFDADVHQVAAQPVGALLGLVVEEVTRIAFGQRRRALTRLRTENAGARHASER